MASIVERLGRWNLRRAGARGERHEVDGLGLHVYTFDGSGHGDIVLLHGVGSSAATFTPLVRQLRPHFARVILPEAPGHGLSEAPTEPVALRGLYELVRALLDGLETDGFTLYGNSLGGGTAIEYAIERPARVERLVLLSPAGARTSQAELDALTQRFELETMCEARAFVRDLFHHPPWYSRFAARPLRARLHTPLVRRVLREARVDDQLEAAAVEALPMPILLMWGASERVLPEAHLTWFRAHLPEHAEIRTPEGYGHSAYIERPAHVAQQICGFCGKA